ncbi:MAG: PilZ domain-containing protein [Polyangiaceae bacterium]|nr:PilZ domain-containing protein [Polyangiaceae bacterium]
MTSERQSERVTINKEFDSFEQFISEYVTNISSTGAFIKTEQPLKIGTEVSLRFSLIMDDIELIEGLGEVTRIQEDPPGMGVVFKQLSERSREVIARLVAVQSGGAP